jgi:hypothetical protein
VQGVAVASRVAEQGDGGAVGAEADAVGGAGVGERGHEGGLHGLDQRGVHDPVFDGRDGDRAGLRVADLMEPERLGRPNAVAQGGVELVGDLRAAEQEPGDVGVAALPAGGEGDGGV